MDHEVATNLEVVVFTSLAKTTVEQLNTQVVGLNDVTYDGQVHYFISIVATDAYVTHHPFDSSIVITTSFNLFYFIQTREETN